jgi:hypothetical protein
MVLIDAQGRRAIFTAEPGQLEAAGNRAGNLGQSRDGRDHRRQQTKKRE